MNSKAKECQGMIVIWYQSESRQEIQGTLKRGIGGEFNEGIICKDMGRFSGPHRLMKHNASNSESYHF